MQRGHGWRLTLMLLGILAAVVMTACNGSRPAPPPAVAPQPAATPREAAVAAYTAISQGNEVGVFAVCKTTPLQRELLSATCKAAAASNEFRDAFIAAYGEEEWAKFGRKKDPQENGKWVYTCQLSTVGPRQIAMLGEVQIDQRGSEAFCMSPPPDNKDSKDGVKPASFEKPVKDDRIRMVKEGNGWLVDSATLVEGNRKTLPVIEGLAKVVKSTQPMIGQPGVTPEQISDALAKRIFGMILTGQ